MTDPVEIIQTVLLVTLMVILVAILYKKLLRKLGSEAAKKKYLNLESADYDRATGMLILDMEAPDPVEIEIFFSGPSLDRKHLIKREIERGERIEEFSVGALSAGKYELEIITRGQHITKYLVID